MSWVIALAVLIVIGDQVTKVLVERWLSPAESVVVVGGFFNLVHWHNSGAAWGMMQGFNWILAGVSVLTMIALYFFRHTLHLENKLARAALGLIVGGIIGNLIDRLRVGAVIDFLDFHIHGHHWPAFNVADSAICVGVVLYIIVTWRAGEVSRPN